jgi:hypothetical protein
MEASGTHWRHLFVSVKTPLYTVGPTQGQVPPINAITKKHFYKKPQMFNVWGPGDPSGECVELAL